MSRTTIKRMRAGILTVGLLGLLSVGPSGNSQGSAAAGVYRSQYKDLRAKATDYLERSRTGRGDRTALQEEGFALVKLVHRLQEEAGRENGDRLRRGQASDKSLLLVAQACVALDFMLTSTGNYNDTGDLAFAQLARQAGVLMNATEQYF